MKYCLIILLFSLTFSSCICKKYQRFEPTKPEVHYLAHLSVTQVDSLNPTLEWIPVKDSTNNTYDVIIYKSLLFTPCQPGSMVYYKENITGTRHKIEKELKPGKKYFWSVRARNGSKVTGWAYYDTNEWWVLINRNTTRNFYTFQTPDK
jgi:hypothetical protein